MCGLVPQSPSIKTPPSCLPVQEACPSHLWFFGLLLFFMTVRLLLLVLTPEAEGIKMGDRDPWEGLWGGGRDLWGPQSMGHVQRLARPHLYSLIVCFIKSSGVW